MMFSIRKAVYGSVIAAVVIIALVLTLVPKTPPVEYSGDVAGPRSGMQGTQDGQNSVVYEKSPYTIKATYSKKTADVDMYIANYGYNLIKPADIAKILFMETRADGSSVTITDGKREAVFPIGKNYAIGYSVEFDTKERKRALYKIPFPAMEIDGEVYVPLRTAARLMEWGVRQIGSTVYLGPDIEVDDANLTFVKYVDEDFDLKNLQ